MDDPHNRRRLLVRPSSIPRPALFLDRDGVVIKDCHHLSNPNQVSLLPGARELLRHANATGWPVVLITNQSGIARGLFDWDAYELVTDRLLKLLGPHAPIAAIYANGHGPDAPASSWRKPSPAMLLAAGLGHVLSGHGQHDRPRVVAHIGTAGQFRGENPSSRQAQVLLLESLLDFPFGLLGPQAPQHDELP